MIKRKVKSGRMTIPVNVRSGKIKLLVFFLPICQVKRLRTCLKVHLQIPIQKWLHGLNYLPFLIYFFSHLAGAISG
jgi:hypothetical protein